MRLTTIFLFLVIGNQLIAQNNITNNWVVTDALGRSLPKFEEVGPVRENRLVGVFYYIWSGHHGNQIYDISKILKMKPDDPLSPDNPGWGNEHAFHFWGEPEYGYFRSEDPWVIRRDLQMLSNAQVDFIFFDVTNAYTYLETVKTLCQVSKSMRIMGTATPKICFLTNSKSGKTMNKLYDEFYSKNLYNDLWFYWDGNPLIMGRASDPELRPEVEDFFTIKYSWAWTNTQSEPNHWQWLDRYPQDWGWSDQPNNPEQITVSVAHHPANPLGKSYHNGSQPPVNENYLTEYTGQGLQFQEQWNRALNVDPEVVMVTQWNEWLAQRFLWDKNKNMYAGRPIKQGDTYFVDVFTAEFNRDIAPMKGGYTDNYYYQLMGNIRRYKGMDAPQQTSPSKTMSLDGDFSEWEDVSPSFIDPKGDVIPRDFPGYDKSIRYKNNTGRNDIIESKVTYDSDNLYFYVKTNRTLTPSTDTLWMLLLLDVDKNMETGWEGYDYVLNRSLSSSGNTNLEKWTGTEWVSEQELKLAINGNKLELSVPRALVKLEGQTPDFYFKWADNPVELSDVTTFFLNGDVAPDRRFKYHFEGADKSTSLNEPKNNHNSIKVYPNPSGDKLRVVFAKNPLKIEIYNTVGTRVYEDIALRNFLEVDVSGWKKGVYIVKGEVEEETLACKIVVE